MRGIIPIYKPSGITSFEVCDTIRSILLGVSGISALPRNKAPRTKSKFKVGHGGTLDKEAEGVLVVGVGEDCKHLSSFLSGSKEYSAIGILGKTTTTYDATGSEIKTSTYDHVTQESLQRVVRSFEGETLQTPPVYSALKIKGQRASNLARKGETVDMSSKRRPICIYQIKLQMFSPPEFGIVLSCSAGTYVRSLIYDIGIASKTVACMKSLCRTKQGPFTLSQALKQDNWTIDCLSNFVSFK
ncbi:PREDICTED: probable tRNA pseudouridine synthase 1 [Amphimedon queenslandica]|uniref:tRNA pseudouridine(55) synthase n=1 Tax=Amphimedon queenslandica TaxID=400682 RepID=A0A1X7VUQ6_AMPQE|nr:PREDICTED: probable tRNA pseudouridine synthase 1 [Amphimedon queenslandica]|eukprot:XP_003382672.1 PREDICTED: probable tRNA pseudouridine synthase 1 [Amphimedon queenslandica]